MLASYTAHMGDRATSLLQNWCEDEGKKLNLHELALMASLRQSTTCMKQVQVLSTNIVLEFYNHIKNM